jgi:hypothetical protein
MRKKISFLFLLLISTLNAQNLDSLYTKFLRMKGLDNGAHRLTSSNEEREKCGFGLVNSIKQNYDKFSLKQKQVLSTLFYRPATDTSIISPRKWFRINFYKSGIYTPKYDINEFAKAADSSYNYEVNILGFLPPPKNANSTYYDIYLDYQYSGFYGVTNPDQQLTENTWTSYIEISNDFSGSSYPTHGIDAARVTIAHELHHAIQEGCYVYRNEDSFYHELTSTSMEEYVFSSVNDYYQYLPSLFDNPAQNFASSLGYNRAIWHLFLTKKFGMEMIKEIWEMMPSKRAVECFAAVIEKHNSTLLAEFNDFGVWMYYTNSRSVDNKYFTEAANYPLLKSSMSTPYTSPNTTFIISSDPISNNILEVTDGVNTIYSIVTNADVKSSISSSSKTSFNLTVSKSQGTDFTQIYSGYYTKLVSSNKSVLKDSYLFNGQEVKLIVNSDFAYPQPFRYSQNSLLFLPAEITPDGFATLSIFSIDMNLVYSSRKTIIVDNKVVVSWTGLDDNGNKLATGVYLFAVQCGDNLRKGKIVIYNN